MNVSLRLQVALYNRLSRCRGQTMAEYALILAAVAMIAYAGFKAMGSATLNGALDEVRENLQ